MAGCPMARCNCQRGRRHLRANGLSYGAPGSEHAAADRLDRTRLLTPDRWLRTPAAHDRLRDRGHQRACVRMRTRAEHVVRRAIFDDAAEIHDGYAIGEVVDHAQVMTD